MTLPRPFLTHKPAIARGLLILFAFTAWSLTAPANVALGLLVLLFLTEVPGHWAQLRREPAVLLLGGVLLVTLLLALRAAWLFPATAPGQWRAVSAWVAPFLFIVPAWWLRRNPGQVWAVLGAAGLGLLFGVLRKSDWSLLPLLFQGLRYDFGFAALGLAFLASVMLVGIILFRARITGLVIADRARPVLGWTLWTAGLALLLFVLVVTQSRGAALMLGIAGVCYGLIQWQVHRPPGTGADSGAATASGTGSATTPPRHRRLALAAALAFIALAGSLLWSTRDRQLADLRQLEAGSPAAMSWGEGASVSIRLDLARVGLSTFAASPLLGFGPGTGTTQFLVPERVVRVSDYQLAQAPAASHLHSVAIEVLTRFGLVGLLIAALLIAVLLRAYRALWIDPRAPLDLRAFLTLGGVMCFLYCLYDFRLVNLDIRFFCILFFGVLYRFALADQDLDRAA